MGLVTIIWVVWGFSLCFGKSGKLFGDPSSYAMLSNIEDAGWLIPGLAFARASSPRPELSETKTPRARAHETASQRESPRGETSRSRLLVRLFRGANRARVPAAVPPQFSTISPAHAGHARGAGLCPPVSDSCFLASGRFFLFFKTSERPAGVSSRRDLPPNDDAPSPLRDTYVFQGMFAVIAPALMTGAFMNRMMFAPCLIFASPAGCTSCTSPSATPCGAAGSSLSGAWRTSPAASSCTFPQASPLHADRQPCPPARDRGGA